MNAAWSTTPRRAVDAVGLRTASGGRAGARPPSSENGVVACPAPASSTSARPPAAGRGSSASRRSVDARARPRSAGAPTPGTGHDVSVVAVSTATGKPASSVGDAAVASGVGSSPVSTSRQRAAGQRRPSCRRPSARPSGQPGHDHGDVVAPREGDDVAACGPAAPAAGTAPPARRRPGARRAWRRSRVHEPAAWAARRRPSRMTGAGPSRPSSQERPPAVVVDRAAVVGVDQEGPTARCPGRGRGPRARSAAAASGPATLTRPGRRAMRGHEAPSTLGDEARRRRARLARSARSASS